MPEAAGLNFRFEITIDRSNDSHILLEHLPPEDAAFHSRAPPLISVEQDALFADLLPEYAILGSKALDDVLL